MHENKYRCLLGMQCCDGWKQRKQKKYSTKAYRLQNLQFWMRAWCCYACRGGLEVGCRLNLRTCSRYRPLVRCTGAGKKNRFVFCGCSMVALGKRKGERRIVKQTKRKLVQSRKEKPSVLKYVDWDLPWNVLEQRHNADEHPIALHEYTMNEYALVTWGLIFPPS